MHTRFWWILGGGLALALSGALGQVHPWVGRLLAPVQLAVAGSGEAAADDELATLRVQVAHLGSENIVLRTRLEDYARITGEGGIPPERVVVARGRIIARSDRAGRRYLELDVGRLDGVAKGMAVCAGWSLVGLVAGTDDGRCLVQLLTDSEFRVAAAIIRPATPASAGAAATAGVHLGEGVFTGTGQRREAALAFLDGDDHLPLEPGQAVVTAGADGRLPAGLVLGRITAASRSSGQRWQVTVVPDRDPERHESLLVLRFTPR